MRSTKLNSLGGEKGAGLGRKIPKRNPHIHQKATRQIEKKNKKGKFRFKEKGKMGNLVRIFPRGIFQKF